MADGRRELLCLAPPCAEPVGRRLDRGGGFSRLEGWVLWRHDCGWERWPRDCGGDLWRHDCGGDLWRHDCGGERRPR